MEDEHAWDLSCLAPLWQRALAKEGICGPDAPARTAIWLSRRGEPSPERVEMVFRRVRGQVSVTDLAKEHATVHAYVQGILRRTGLLLLVPHLGQVVAWARARDGQHGDEQIASLAGLAPEIVTLALNGWPDPRRTGDAQVVEALERWRSGAPLAEVASALGMPRKRLAAELRTGKQVLTPARLFRRDLAARFGWSASSADRYRRAGTLPPPDGHEGAHWWWEPTITAWAGRQGLLWCRACRRSFLSETGLKEHNTRKHRP